MPRIQTADITALIRERFQIKGAGSIDTLAPELVGVINVDQLMPWRSMTPDVLQPAAVVVGAANTTVSTVFSLGRDGFLYPPHLFVTANPANLAWARVFFADPAGQGNQVIFIGTTTLALATIADRVVPDVGFRPNELSGWPLFIKSDWDITVQVRSGAGGGLTVGSNFYALIDSVR